MAKFLWLDLCEFRQGCDLCEGAGRPWSTIGRTWVQMSGGECAEASCYICDACLPERYRDALREFSHYKKERPCFVCRDATGVFIKTVDRFNACDLCQGIGVIFTSVRPYPVRAEAGFAYAMRRASATKGRRQKHWRREAQRWHKEAVRESDSIKQKTPPPRSMGHCEGCGNWRQRPWLDTFRRHCRFCFSCSWKNLVKGLAHEEE